MSSRVKLALILFIIAIGLIATIMWLRLPSSTTTSITPNRTHREQKSLDQNSSDSFPQTPPLREDESFLDKNQKSEAHKQAANAHKERLLLHQQVNIAAGVLTPAEIEKVKNNGNIDLLLGLMMTGEYSASNFFTPDIFSSLDSSALSTLLTNPDLSEEQINECLNRLREIDQNDFIPVVLGALTDPLSFSEQIPDDFDIKKHQNASNIYTKELLVNFLDRDPDLVAGYNAFNSASPWTSRIASLAQKLTEEEDFKTTLANNEQSRENVITVISSIASNGKCNYEEYQNILTIQEHLLDPLDEHNYTRHNNQAHTQLSLLYALPEIRLLQQGDAGLSFDASIERHGTLEAVRVFAERNPELIQQCKTIFDLGHLAGD